MREKAFGKPRSTVVDSSKVGAITTRYPGLIAGRPVYRIASSVLEYPDFLTWWREVGRLKPEDHEGWASLSGPHVMRGRTEMIHPKIWKSLSWRERREIMVWARGIPLTLMYD